MSTAPTYSTGGPSPFTGGFAAYFPQYQPSSAEQTWITAMLSKEWDELDAGVYGVFRSEVALERVAHRYVLSFLRGSGGEGGALTQENVGDWSQSFAPPSPASTTDSFWAQTKHGQRYLEIRRARLLRCSRITRR